MPTTQETFMVRVIRGDSHSVALPSGRRRSRAVDKDGNEIEVNNDRVREFRRAKGWHEVKSKADADFLREETAYQRLDPDRNGVTPTSAQPPPRFEVRTKAEALAIQEREKRAASARTVEDPEAVADDGQDEQDAPEPATERIERKAAPATIQPPPPRRRRSRRGAAGDPAGI